MQVKQSRVISARVPCSLWELARFVATVRGEDLQESVVRGLRRELREAPELAGVVNGMDVGAVSPAPVQTQA